jgi:hypothetical protein
MVIAAGGLMFGAAAVSSNRSDHFERLGGVIEDEEGYAPHAVGQ